MEVEKSIDEKIDDVIKDIAEKKGPLSTHELMFFHGIGRQAEFFKEELPEFANKNELVEAIFKENHNTLVNFIENFDENSNKEIYNCLSCFYGSFLADATCTYCVLMEPSRENWEKSNEGKKVFEGNPMFGDAPGQVTDASELAMAQAYAIMDMPKKNEYNPRYAYFYYGAFVETEPKDLVKATKQALYYFDIDNYDIDTIDWRYLLECIDSYNKEATSNDFLFRATSLIIWFYYRNNDLVKKSFIKDQNGKFSSKLLFDLYSETKKISETANSPTHTYNETYSALGLYMILGLAAICGFNHKDILSSFLELINSDDFKNGSKDMDGPVADFFRERVKIFSNEQFNSWNYFAKDMPCIARKRKYYHAFSLTLYFLIKMDDFLKLDDPFNEIMKEICNFGGDTDSNGAIVGAIIGPIFGYKNLGKHFKTMIELLPYDREYYSPSLMVLYLDYIIRTNKRPEEIKNKSGFLKMMMTMLFSKVDTTKLFK